MEKIKRTSSTYIDDDGNIKTTYFEKSQLGIIIRQDDNQIELNQIEFDIMVNLKEKWEAINKKSYMH